VRWHTNSCCPRQRVPFLWSLSVSFRKGRPCDVLAVALACYRGVADAPELRQIRADRATDVKHCFRGRNLCRSPDRRSTPNETVGLAYTGRFRSSGRMVARRPEREAAAQSWPQPFIAASALDVATGCTWMAASGSSFLVVSIGASWVGSKASVSFTLPRRIA
jgi:hypothetical protein